MQVLFGYHYYRYPVDVRQTTETLMQRYRDAGFNVKSFPLTLNPPGPKVNWPLLDTCWRRGDRQLMAMYEQLAKELEGCSVFLNYGGLNIHPEFLRQLPTFNVMIHFDDPENSETVSKPVAHAYDLCLVCNRSEVDTYFSWGAKRAEFLPLGYRHDDADPNLTLEKVRSQKRDVDLTILCERETLWRRERLDKICAAFPQGRYHGLGWSTGFLEEADRIPLYGRTKVGINLHNTSGPINVRLYALPANGVMQICDCKNYLGDIFEIGKEIVAYDTTEEAIDLCRYYLDHEEERLQIAAAGYERAVRDYNEVAVFRRAMDRIQHFMALDAKPREDLDLVVVGTKLEKHKHRTRWSSKWHATQTVYNNWKHKATRWAARTKNQILHAIIPKRDRGPSMQAADD